MRKIAFLASLFLALPALADLRQEIVSRTGLVAYSVPISGHHVVCSWDDYSENIVTNRRELESSSALYVIYNVNGGAIDSIRLSSPECTHLSREVQWLQNVDPAESARLLKSLIDGPNREVAKKAVAALALHRGSTDALIDIAKHNPNSNVRSRALFWVSQAAGDRAASVLKDAINNDPEEEVKAKAVFGVSQLPDDESIPILIDLIKTNRSAMVRKKAAFWLGQKDDPRALTALEDILKR
jgi:HEAT repeat protein